LFPTLRPIDRVRIIQEIARAIDNSMDFDDIRIFFKAMGKSEPYMEDDHYSQNYLVRAYLDTCSENELFDIGSQLGLDRVEENGAVNRFGDSKYWLLDHYRLFISHVHTQKKSAGALRQSLQRYAVSCFVSHDDIEPSAEWRDEILRALGSMDGFLAILSEDFNTSKYCDQETGVAVGRDVMIVAINKGLNTYGLIDKYQTIQSLGKNVREVANDVFRTIVTNPKSRAKMLEALARGVVTASDVKTATFRAEKLQEVDYPDWGALREQVATNSILRKSKTFLNTFNAYLEERDIQPITEDGHKLQSLDDEILF